MVSWWPGEGNGLDLGGTNNALLQNGVSFLPGEVGQAFSFDGINQYAEVLNSPQLNLTGAITIEAWVYPVAPPDVPMTIVSKDGVTTNRQYLLNLVSSPQGAVLLRGHVGMSSGFAVLTGHQPISLNAWTHVAMAYDGSNLQLYVNGVLDSSVQAPGQIITTPENLLMGASTGGYPFEGLIDELALYSRSLSPGEIAAIYNAGSDGKCHGNVAPVILMQPTNQTVFVGETAIFTMTAGGTPPLQFQWQLNGQNVGLGTRTTLYLADAQASLAGDYTIVVTNAFGSVTSAPALLTVNSTAPGCTPPPLGLVSWWPGEGSGADTVGTNTGTLVNGVGFARGMVNSTFVLNGAQFVQVADSPSLNPLRAVSMEGWVFSFGAGNPVTIFSKDDGFSSRQFLLNLVTTATGQSVLRAHIGLQTGFQILESTRAIPTNAWTHVAMVYDGSKLSLYENGALDSSQPAQGLIVVTPQPFVIGADGAGAYPFNGFIDELSFYRRGLSPQEIACIYFSGGAGKCVSNTAPFIFVQPTNQTAYAGGVATLAVVAGGTPPVAYQWTFNGADISNALQSSLTLSNLQASQSGVYAVRLSNPVGSLVSSNAVLTVSPPPTCLTPPAGIVSWWAAEGDGFDQLGLNPGALTGKTTYGPGYVGQAFVFDGSGSGVIIGDPTNLQLQDFTIEGWIRRGSSSIISGSGFLGFILGYGNSGYGFAMGNDGSLMLTKVGVSSVNTSGAVTDTNFHHVAVTKAGIVVNFYIDGVQYSVGPYDPGFAFSSPVAIGTLSNTGSDGFLGSIDELSVYNRALSSGEIQTLYFLGSLGKCRPPLAPFVVTQPASMSLFAGDVAQFGVVVEGTRPFGYQWHFNDNIITGATNASLQLIDIQPAQAGSYSVVITNTYGAVTSSPAELTVSARPAQISLPQTNAICGQLISLPVTVEAKGDENVVTFSLLFDPSLLVYSNASLAQGLLSAGLLVDTSRVNGGQLGVALALSPGMSLTPGTQDLMHVTFSTRVLTNSAATGISFSDSPIPRQLLDQQGSNLPVTYVDGAVDIAFIGFEGDVFPRPDGNNSLTISDWVQAGQYAARITYPTNQSEFERADCAPRSSSGNGAITVADWVQVGRYVLGLDPPAPLGGPVSEVPYSGPGGSTTRTLTAGTTTLTPGQTSIIDLDLSSQGNENALGFSLRFDAARASFSGISLGPSAAGATLYVNTNLASSGVLGVVLSMNPGTAFATGAATVLQVSFQAAPSSGFGSFAPGFTNYPVIPEVCDQLALPLPVNLVDSFAATTPPPRLTAYLSSQHIAVSWSASATNFILQETMGLYPFLALWSNSAATPFLSNGQQTVIFPIGPTDKFFRLYQP